MNDNTEMARALYAAVGRGVIAAVPGTPAPDVHWTPVEGGLHQRPRRGG